MPFYEVQIRVKKTYMVLIRSLSDFRLLKLEFQKSKMMF